MITTAIILAGGFGTRLQSVISDLPKPLAPINNQPFLNFQLNYLKYYGIKNVVLSVGYLSQKIKNYYGSEYNGIKITYAEELVTLGTGGGIRLAMMASNTDLAFVLNGDSFFDIDLNLFYKRHLESQSQLSLALRKVSNAARYGTIEKNEFNRILSFTEKTEVAKDGIINGGVYILSKSTYLPITPSEINFSIEKDFFEKQLSNLKINGFEFDNYFIDIGIPEDYLKAQNDFKEFKYN